MEQKKPQKNFKKKYEQWESEGTQAYYVRFHAPVPPAVNKEPVSEFCLEGPTNKYKVDKITICEHGVVFRAFGEIGYVNGAQMQYSRLII